MKKLFQLLFVFCLSLKSHSQNINADCISAIPLCSTPSFTFNATSGVGNVADIPANSNVSNPSTNPASSNSGCLLSGELKPQWLLITVGNAGNLEFIFGAGNSTNPQVGFYDWAMWPYSPTACGNIQNNTLPPIRCNWNASSSGGTGIASLANQPPSSSTGNFEPPLAVLPCQQYIICISNYSGVNTLVSFQSVGTASLSCNPSCISVNNPSLCSGNTASIIAASSGNLSNISFSLNPGGLTSNTPTFNISPTINTTYTVYATGLNSSSVAVTQTAVSNVTVYPQPQVAPTTTQATCLNTSNGFNLNLNFSPSSPVPNYTVTWSTIPIGVNSPTQTSASGTLTPGVYTATITSAGGCFTVTSFTINAQPAPASIVLSPFGPNYTVTCFDPILSVNAVNTSFSYTWTNGIIAPIVGTAASFSNNAVGIWTITAVNPLSGCVSTKTINVGQNTVTPSSVVSPSFQNITCNLSSITTVTATSSTTLNITHVFTSPQGGTFTANTSSVAYLPGAPGIYTYCIINDVNGCSNCKTFTVASNQGFPTFSVSSPQSFTLGCNTKSVATINIINGSTSLPPGGPVSYTLLAPGASTVIPSGTLSPLSSYTVNTPGTWTVITKDNTSFCETRVPISIIANTQGPKLDSLIIPSFILDCNLPQVMLQAISSTPNTGYNWSFPGATGNLPTSTLVVHTNSLTPTATLIANYTLTLTDNNNTCITTSVVPMLQNTYPPKAAISNGGVSALTCKTATLFLTNISTSGIPANSIFPNSKPVIADTWDGPSPQVRQQVTSTYLGSTVGQYTMIARDMNNGCTSSTVIAISDNRIYPAVNNPDVPAPFILDCGSNSATISPIFSNSITGLTFSWTAPPGAITSDPNKVPLLTNKIGIYRILTQNIQNGCATNAEVSVINGTLTTGITATPVYGFAPLTVTLANTSSSTTGSNNINSAWTFGNGTNSITSTAASSPVITYNLPGTYTVTSYITKGSCVGTATALVNVELPSLLEIPNVFSPNGDNVNDVFFLKTANLDEISIWIYDRWGHKVYELVSSKGNIAWDGKNQFGKDVAEGTYMYILKATGKDGAGFEKKGNISLFR